MGFGPVNPGLGDATAVRRDSIFDFYRQFALGDIGLVYVGGVAVSPSGHSNRGSLVMTEPVAVRLITGVAETVQPSGTRLAVQLMHSGRQASAAEIGHQPVVASALPCPYDRGPRTDRRRARLRVGSAGVYTESTDLVIPGRKLGA